MLQVEFCLLCQSVLLLPLVHLTVLDKKHVLRLGVDAQVAAAVFQHIELTLFLHASDVGSPIAVSIFGALLAD